MCFINLSNHPLDTWGEKQRNAALEYGELAELPFPQVPAEATEEDIRFLADDIVRQILKLAPAAVMCQGEFTLTYQIVSRLKEKGIMVLSACSTRNVKEISATNGITHKETIFEFVKFRNY